MTIHVELKPEMEGQLTAQARARGMELEDYARNLLENALLSSADRTKRAGQEEFRAFLDDLARDTSDVPQLHSQTFSRDAIYGDHS